MDLEKFAENINTTGFVLEFRISQLLRDHDWNVINNRYYIDDITGTVREIDIVAYKAAKFEEYNTFTGLIISCKKSAGNVWVLLSKERNLTDPNIDWTIAHTWTNHKALKFMTDDRKWREQYFASAASAGISHSLCIPETHIFAFQEMKKSNYHVQNNKAIFESVTSLIKAQAYEIESLDKRKRAPCLYQFNLLSVFDSDLIRLSFTQDDIIALEVPQDHYLIQYIVNQRATSAIVHFVTEGAFQEILDDYDKLHQFNDTYFKSLHHDFYADAVENSNKREVYLDDFISDILWYITWRVSSKIGKEQIRLYWEKSDTESLLHIEIDSDVDLEKCNDDRLLKERIGAALEQHYKYTGPFKITKYDIPF
ncbi:hypothetical protein ACFL45_11445 [Candidatus Neomarinimicrobiota bacterium]